jgi:hypothetical protein|tara:strand:- start:573 stop:848 length:276 start_codon:yes stop_codon:yes gene_type:complete
VTQELMSPAERLLDEAAWFCDEFGLSDSSFGVASPINDGHLMKRIRSGRVRRITILRVARWMRYVIAQEAISDTESVRDVYYPPNNEGAAL